MNSMSKTVLQVNSALNYSSTGKIAEQIGLLVKDLGWNSVIAHGPRYVRPSLNTTVQIGNSFDEISHAIKSQLFDMHGLGSIASTNRFLNQIKEIHPDIVHLHNIHGYYLNYQKLFSFLSQQGIPVVWTLHDCWSFTGHCVYFDAIGCEKWRSGCGSCPQINSYPKSVILDRSAINFQVKKKNFTKLKHLTLVPVSYWLEDLLKQSFMNGYSSHVIHNGVDVNVFHPVSSAALRHKLDLDNKHMILGVASGWNEGRRLADFISLSSLLSDDYVIVLVGLSDAQISNLPPNIIGVRRTNNQNELAEYYSAADVFVYPTYEDNFPTVNLEALACGTPVITYNTGGSPEAIDDKTGRVVEKGNVYELFRTIQRLREIPLSPEDCRKRAVELFDCKNCFKEYIGLYKSILLGHQ